MPRITTRRGLRRRYASASGVDAICILTACASRIPRRPIADTLGRFRRVSAGVLKNNPSGCLLHLRPHPHSFAPDGFALIGARAILSCSNVRTGACRAMTDFPPYWLSPRNLGRHLQIGEALLRVTPLLRM